ncbi:MAG: hypothetical protein HGA25_02075 [Clostridiales bacterium]|nr:hypothetical protein [Clostridiales bacterium]
MELIYTTRERVYNYGLMTDIPEQLNYDPTLEAQELDRAIVCEKTRQAHFTSSEKQYLENSKFYSDVIPFEYSTAIFDRFWNIFSSEMNLFTTTSIDILRTETGLLHMDVSCGALIITFEIDTETNNGTVNHRGMCKESQTVSSWNEYGHKDIFLLGKAVFDDYFWHED